MKSLQQRLINAGIKIDHHATDLYFEDTLESREILREYKTESAVICKESYFIEEVDNKPWIKVPFAYQPKLINNESLWGTK
jgi:hypothetical protein